MGFVVEIRSRFVGTPLRSLEVTVTSRQTMNYAAAVGDSNPITSMMKHRKASSRLYAGCGPDMADLRTYFEYLQSGDFPWELLLTQVHYTEHLQFHRPVRPGERLFIRGKVAAIIPIRPERWWC